MSLRGYLSIAQRWWWLFVLGPLVAGGVAFALSRSQTPVYRAKAVILVNQAQDIAGRPSYNDILASQQLSKTYSRLVTSGPVLNVVAENLSLPNDELTKMVSASVARDTQLIEIFVRNSDPELAARIANETANVFAVQIRETQLGQQSTSERDLQNQVTALQSSVDERQATVNSLRSPQPGLGEAERQQQLTAAQTELDGLNQALTTAQRRLQDLRVELSRSINSVSLADPAITPSDPVSPRVLLNTVLAAIAGLIVAVAIAALMEYLDDTVKSADDVRDIADIPTLGSISRFASMESRRKSADGRKRSTLLTDSRDSRTLAEDYRVVRTSLEFARSGRSTRTMLVTSAMPQEGKSTTAANLAIVLAQTGRRIILVDADFRRPSQHKLFDMPNTSGFSTLFVADRISPAEVLRATPLETLRILPTGPLPPNPAELLSSSRARELISRLEAEADMVIIDSPPLLGIADSSALAAQVDGVLLIVDSGRTRPGALAQAVERLRGVEATILGVILNKLQKNRSEGYYYYSTYSSHGPVDESNAYTVTRPAAHHGRNGTSQTVEALPGDRAQERQP